MRFHVSMNCTKLNIYVEITGFREASRTFFVCNYGNRACMCLGVFITEHLKQAARFENVIF